MDFLEKVKHQLKRISCYPFRFEAHYSDGNVAIQLAWDTKNSDTEEDFIAFSQNVSINSLELADLPERCFMAAQELALHEVYEHFKVDGKRMMTPHFPKFELEDQGENK